MTRQACPDNPRKSRCRASTPAALTDKALSQASLFASGFCATLYTLCSKSHSDNAD